MLKNYFKSAFRFLKHNRVFAGINLMGLSIALAASFIMLLYVINELSYNHCFKNRYRVFTVLSYDINYKMKFALTPYILATALKEQFPQVGKAVRTYRMRGFSLKLKDEVIAVDDAIATDSDIFDIFTLRLIRGSDNNNLLDDQNSIVLSRDLAEKLFPGQNPVGMEIVGFVNNIQNVFKVTGVFENIPVNSTFRAQCFLNIKWSLEPANKSMKINNADQNWRASYWTTWLLLSKNTDHKILENQFRAFEIKNMGENSRYQFSLQNLRDIYLDSADVVFAGITGNKSKVRLFSAIALLILLVASLNYIVLSTAISTGRGLEIGIRKISGAINRSIKSQLLSESVLLAMIALPLALILMRIAIAYAGKLFQVRLNIINSNIIVYLIVYVALTMTIGIISGLYTSSYLSGLKVLDILKNTLHSGKRKQFFRSSLIVLQLVIFCSVVSSALIIHSQYIYSLNMDPGYFNKDVLLIKLGGDFKGYSAYINSIRSSPNVIMAGGTGWGIPTLNSSINIVPNYQDKKVKVQIEDMRIDYDFLKTMGITLIKGRDFSQEYGSDLTESTILNETAVKQLGIDDPVGKVIDNKTIIGVVKDFNLHSIRSKIPPVMILLTDQNIEQIAVHYKPGSLNSLLPMFEAEWKKAAPDKPFRFSKLEDVIRNIYSGQRNLITIVSVFALLIVLIASSGLFGLTLFLANSRKKEIGIKKAFGSSGQSIIYSFLIQNLILVLIAAVISVPVTLYFMLKWLNNFAFKADINLWVFVISFSIAAVVVILTVFIHSYKASHINPVEALKYE